MAFVSLYRKYRSQTFGDLVGQDHVIRTLQNAVVSGRIAHAYLFTGPRGTGKTSTARLLAKALNCEKGPTGEPCNVCASCVGITEGNALDVLELDAASEAGVEDVRENIVGAVQYAPNHSPYRIFIIDEVHDLSAKAFDALLKTIEEPPSHVVFILATTEYNKVPPTIRSRCQKFEFHRATLSDLQRRLQFVAAEENIAIEPAAVAAIARMADGGFRDALTLLEQARLLSEGPITLNAVYDQLGLIANDQTDQLLLAIRHRNVPQILETLAELSRRGRDPRAILESLLLRGADLTHALYQRGEGVDPAAEAAAHATATQLGAKELLFLRGALAEAHRTIRDITLPRLWLESELIRLSQWSPTDVTASVTGSGHAAVQDSSSGVAKAVVETRSPAPSKAAPAERARESLTAPGEMGAAGADPKWRQAWEALAKVSRTMGTRLEGVSVSRQGDELLLTFSKKMDRDWVNDDPRKLGTVQKVVHEVYGDEVTVKLVHLAEEKPELPTAVELELRGPELYDEIKRINREGEHDETS